MPSNRKAFYLRRFWIIVRVTMLGVVVACMRQPLLAAERDTQGTLDAKQLIDALANHNPKPKLVETYADGYTPLFDANYDWREYDRVTKAVRFLKRHAEEVWPELLRHFDDPRYCITVGTIDIDSATNYTVGQVCQRIVRQWLTAAHERHTHYLILNKLDYWSLHDPKTVKASEDLKTWCDARKDKKLYELQIDMCRWAIGQAAKINQEPERREAFIKALQVEIEAIEHTRAPVGYIWIGEGRGDAVPYNVKKAAKLRDLWEKQKAEEKQ